MRKSKIIENQKKKIEDLIAENIRLEILLNNLENIKHHSLEQERDILEMALDIEKKKNKKLKEIKLEKMKDLLKDYKYVILVDEKNRTNFWNDGRFEYGVKGLYFNIIAGELPEIIVEK